MNTIKVTNTANGEVKEYKGKLMVAPNGVIFIKADGRTLFASASTDFVCEEV